MSSSIDATVKSLQEQLYVSEILILSASIFTTPAVAEFYALDYSLDFTE